MFPSEKPGEVRELRARFPANSRRMMPDFGLTCPIPSITIPQTVGPGIPGLSRKARISNPPYGLIVME